MRAVLAILFTIHLAHAESTVTVTGEGTAIGLGPAARSKAIADAQAAIVLE
ncbi:MAG: hypothetical protein IT367_10590, partial [Candidatus Hydrogenedentes bacterium]|nr:hypothetical protein [Candidatus Hydrogenedentota bacterium]